MITATHARSAHSSVVTTDEPLHIVHVMQYFETGGLERMVLALAMATRALGHKVSVIAYLKDGPMRDQFTANGIDCAVMHGKDGLDPLLPVKLAAALRSLRADVVHTHHVGPFLYTALPAKLLGVRHIHTEHSHEFYGSQRIARVGKAMPRFATVTCVSKEIAAWRAENLRTADKIIPNGVLLPSVDPTISHSARKAMGLRNEDLVIGCVARLAAEKDHATLIRAFQRVRARVPNAKLVIAGDGPLRAKLERQVRDAALTTSVKFLGNRSDIDKLYPGMDLVALTSTREGLPMALLEAMSHGVPVVATRVGEVDALLAQGGGSSADASDADGIADALIRYITDPNLLRTQGRAARARVERDFSVNAMTRRYLDLYKKK